MLVLTARRPSTIANFSTNLLRLRIAPNRDEKDGQKILSIHLASNPSLSREQRALHFEWAMLGHRAKKAVMNSGSLLLATLSANLTRKTSTVRNCKERSSRVATPVIAQLMPAFGPEAAV
jgi:hypothetical protein